MTKQQLKNLNESLKSKKIQFKQFMMTAYKPKQLFYAFKLVLDLRAIKNNKLPCKRYLMIVLVRSSNVSSGYKK